jgi:hypothetical protein
MAQTRNLVANWLNAEKYEGDENAALHLLFTYLVNNRASSQCSFDQVVVNLYRLFVWDGWNPARTYLFMMTGVLCDPECDAELFLRKNGSALVCEQRTILQQCMDVGGILTNVSYTPNDEDDESDEEDTDYDDDDDDEDRGECEKQCDGSTCAIPSYSEGGSSHEVIDIDDDNDEDGGQHVFGNPQDPREVPVV